MLQWSNEHRQNIKQTFILKNNWCIKWCLLFNSKDFAWKINYLGKYRERSGKYKNTYKGKQFITNLFLVILNGYV